MYNIHEMVRVSKMYYELKMTQQEIAQKENISRPTVSRILDSAIKEGIVSFLISYPLESVNNVADEFKETFNLENVFVSPVYVKNHDLISIDVGKALTSHLSEIVKDGDIIGITWGNTLTYVASNLIPMNKNNIKVVQLAGGGEYNIRFYRGHENT